VREIRASEAGTSLERGVATTTLPELKRGSVAVAFATLFAAPAELWTHPGYVNPTGYRTPEEAQSQALEQLNVYDDWASRGVARLVRSVTDLEHHLELWRSDRVPGLVVLMEGADPIVNPDDVGLWWSRGVRIIGTSWGATRYAGGTEAPGGLTNLGRELVAAMKAQGVILDVSHQSWESFWDSLEVGVHRVIASHSNSFALRATTNRHLTDAMIRAIGERDGRVGVVLLNSFLEPRWVRDDRRTPVTVTNQVRRHLEHTIADLVNIGEVVPSDARAGVLGGNWLEFLRGALPRSSD
jgi:membrane dipeptidase